MAQEKNSKKEMLLSATGSFFEIISMMCKWASLTCGFVFFVLIIMPIWWAFDVLALLTSFIWFPILIWWDNQKASELVNVKQKPDESNFFEAFCDALGLPFQNWCNTVVLRTIWTPVINHLPMKYRDWFIFTGKRPFSEYSVETQIEYWEYEKDEQVRTRLLCDGINENGVVHKLSTEAIDALWQKDGEIRRLWATKRLQESKEKFFEIVAEKPEWFKSIILSQTPTNTVYGWLIEAGEDNEYALGLVERLAKQAMPKLEVLYQIFAKETAVSKMVAEILDKRADKRATMHNITSRFPAVSSEKEDEELEKAKREVGMEEVQRWINFCHVKAEITTEAQMKMTPWQYFIFARGHHLTIQSLQRALFNLKYRGWVVKLMQNEWENIEHPLVLPLIKADNDLYNIYLEIKADK